MQVLSHRAELAHWLGSALSWHRHPVAPTSIAAAFGNTTVSSFLRIAIGCSKIIEEWQRSGSVDFDSIS